jgi:hypothetical protein
MHMGRGRSEEAIEMRDSMKRILIIAALLIWIPTTHANMGVEVATGVHHTEDATLLLLDLTRPANALFGQTSYWQLNAGGWSGEHKASVVGVARGLQWDSKNVRVRLSAGVSLISETSEMLSTAFQFYEQAMVRRQFGNHGIALSYRHWSNGYIKHPNYGMDFLGIQMDLNW